MININFLGENFKNPVIAASGTYGFGREYEEFYDPGLLGGISSKGLTLNFKEGNEGIRLFETPSGLMNSIGLQNPGIKAFIKDELAHMLKYNTQILVNLGGNCKDDYLEAIELLEETDCKFIELNISCPNVKSGGLQFGKNAKSVKEIVNAVRPLTTKKLIVKLSPNADNIAGTAIAAEEGGADAVSLVNTFNAMAIDIHNRKPVFGNITAGLSGPAIYPIALRMVYETAKAVRIPVIGMGGITTANDAIGMMMAGASLIQVGTANFRNPFAALEIIEGLESYCEKEGIKDISEIIGCI